ncbi:MAG: hypothetical protein OQL16_05685 [Gammaproteobacteria bacterium]|nr:hypothetical protein [Gammaproteobacteria bacterium]
MYRIRLILASALFVGMVGNVHAVDSRSRYQSWQPPAGETVQSAPQADDSRLQKMIDELNQLINDAEKDRAADRRFLQDLRDVVNQYDWPWRKILLEEDFTDGSIQKKSSWKIISGDFKLQRGLGLHSDVAEQQATPERSSQSENDAAALLIGALLDQAMKSKKQSPSPSEPSRFDSHASIIGKIITPNAFAITMDIDVRSHQGKLELGVYQGSPDGSGYRVVFQPGPTASIEVQRIGSRGVSIIDVADKINAKGDRVHQLQWTRSKQGNMNILLNDQTILQVADRSFKDKFTGVVINNKGGEFALQGMTIQGG